jgi:hypothetical protein
MGHGGQSLNAWSEIQILNWLIKKQQKLALPDHQQPPLMSLQNNHTTRSRHAQSHQHNTVGHFAYFGSISFHIRDVINGKAGKAAALQIFPDMITLILLSPVFFIQ